jgi:hypothetical protein
MLRSLGSPWIAHFADEERSPQPPIVDHKDKRAIGAKQIGPWRRTCRETGWRHSDRCGSGRPSALLRDLHDGLLEGHVHIQPLASVRWLKDAGEVGPVRVESGPDAQAGQDPLQIGPAAQFEARHLNDDVSPARSNTCSPRIKLESSLSDLGS